MDPGQMRAVEAAAEAGANRRAGAALQPSALVVMLFGAIQIIAAVGEPQPRLLPAFLLWVVGYLRLFGLIPLP